MNDQNDDHLIMNYCKSLVSSSLLVGLLTLLMFSSASGQTAPQKEIDFYNMTRIRNSIRIDGRLEEQSWQGATKMPVEVQRFPDPNAEVPVETIFYITYDNNHIYAAFKAMDPRPGAIKAHLMDRDEQEKLNRDDYVGFTVDPFNNGQWGYQFRVNPLGVQADALYSDRSNTANFSWDAIWKSEARITEEGYVVEVRIPFSSISSPDQKQQTWLLSAFRNYPRNVKYKFRSHFIDLDNSSFMDQFDRLQGIDKVSSDINLKISPTLTAKRSDQNNASADRIGAAGIGFKPGGNIEWGIRPNMNLNATINPDYSQVEADALRLRENRRFILSFPEKRPFFLESGEIFETPMQAVFTRSIVEPQFGVKFTGKSERHSFGSFVTRDQATNLVFPSNQRSESKILEQNTNSEVFRYRSMISPDVTLGALAVGRQATQSRYFNNVGGIDGVVDVLHSSRLQFQYLRSLTRYTDDISQNYDQPSHSFAGDALKTLFTHNSRRWSAEAEFTSVDPTFRNDNGLFRRADFRAYRMSAQRIFRGSSDRWFSSIRLGPSYERVTDLSGQLTDRTLSISVTYTGSQQSEVILEYSRAKQRFEDQLFSRLNSGVFFIRLRPSDIWTKFRTYISYGGAIDYTNVRKSRELIIHPGFVFDFSHRLHLELDPNYQAVFNNGKTTFNTYLLGQRIIYHFNKRIFLRSIFQYRYTDRNLDQYRDPNSLESAKESFFYQLLFSYKLNPQSKFYLGYSSGYQGLNNNRLQMQSRTGFMKVGYSFSF